MALTLIYVFCIALTAQLISAQDQVMDPSERAQYLISTMWPRLNYSCVANGCPKVADGFARVCPSNNRTFVRLVTNAHACMTKPLCGLVLDPEPIPTITFSAESLPGFGNGSVCSVVKGSVFTNTSRARVTDIHRTPRQVNISVSMPDIAEHTHLTCNGGNFTVFVDNFMSFSYNIIYNKTHITVVNPKFTPLSVSFKFVSTKGDIINKITQSNPEELAGEGELFSATYVPFLTNYYQIILKILKKDCKIYLNWN